MTFQHLLELYELNASMKIHTRVEDLGTRQQCRFSCILIKIVVTARNPLNDLYYSIKKLVPSSPL